VGRRDSCAARRTTLYWTHTTSSANEGNFGQWNLFFMYAGIDALDVTPPPITE
jgi:hypothetical protein